jgi:Cu+-exporting ATPase
MSVMVATGRGAESGVLVRDAEALERFAEVDVLVVDKTGTLTEGRPRVVDILPIEGSDAADFLRLAASLEQGSEHPLAEAVLDAAKERSLILSPCEKVEAIIGKGIRGVVDDRVIALGNLAFMHELEIACLDLDKASEELASDGKTVLFVAIDGKFEGVMAITDRIRETTPGALKALRKNGLRLVMATGDNRQTAEKVATELGIDEVHAEIGPGGKANLVQGLQSRGLKVAMAGDGINDAPALAAADAGIAMGTGADVAIESAGLTLVKGDLAGIVRAHKLALATMRNIRQNLFFAFVYNAAGVPIAAGVLYPLFGLLLSPMIAALAMSLSSISVIGNALRLRQSAL